MKQQPDKKLVDAYKEWSPAKSVTRTANPLPAMSDEDLFNEVRASQSDGIYNKYGESTPVEELIARYESAKRDLNDYSEI